MDTRLTGVEDSCGFISEKYEDQTPAINTTKGNVESLKQMHETLEKLSSLTKEKVNLGDRLSEMESRSMRENLLFQGLH